MQKTEPLNNFRASKASLFLSQFIRAHSKENLVFSKVTQFEEFFVPEKAQNGIGKKIFAYDRHFFNDANFVMQRLRLTQNNASPSIGVESSEKMIGFERLRIFTFHCCCTLAKILNGKMICSNYDRIKRVLPSASITKENQLSSSSLRDLFEDALLSRLKDKLGSATYNPYPHEFLMGVLSCKHCP